MQMLLIAALFLSCQQEPPKPGPHHKHLAMEVGTWDAKGTLYMGKDPLKFQSTETVKLICNGLWIQVDVVGDMGPMGKLQGHGIYGYDTTKKKYVGTWVDNHGTSLGTVEGQCSDDGKVRTLFTKGADQSGKMQTWKQVLEFHDQDTKTFTMYVQDTRGRAPRFVRIMEIKSTRRQKEPDYVTVQHILISFRGKLPGKNIARTKEEAKKLAEDVLKQAKSGADFDALVKKYTDDQHPGIYSMANFGIPADREKKIYARKRMVPAFGNTGFPLKVGGIGMASFDPRKSPYGWHIVKRIK